MSSTKTGLPSDKEIRPKASQKFKDKQMVRNFSKEEKAAIAAEYNHVTCNGRRKSNPETEQDQDQDLSDTSPDISLSSQKTLKYSDVEPEQKEHDISQESSDSIETLEEPPDEDCHTEINESFLQQLSLTHHASGSSMDSVERLNPVSKQRGSSFSDSGDSHEVIPEFSNAPRPESLSLPRPLQAIEREQIRSNSEKHTNDDDDIEGPEPSPTSSQPSDIQMQGAHFIGPSSDMSQTLPQGTITRKGDLIQFVADDLTEKIKQSSPLSHADAVSTGSRRSSVRSIASASSSTSFATSSGVSRSPSSLFQQSPDDIPPIDASAVIELENHARRVADSLDLMMGNIRNNLHKMSAITIGCQDAYKRSVDITCDSVDASIKAMYALMAKCEELSAAMGPVEQLAAQIKEIKRILDLFESQLTDK